MGRCAAKIHEIRFVLEDELTQTYVLVEALGDCPLGVQGWHHKTFPASKSAMDILKEIRDGDSPVMWHQQAP